MAVAQVSASLSLYVPDVSTVRSVKGNTISVLPFSGFARMGSAFVTGTPLVRRTTSRQRMSARKAASVSIRCEQSTQGGNSLDVWIGRAAMISFAAAISVEIATGKGLLENIGLASPLPTVALAVTGLAGVLTAVFVFQSASKN